MPSTANTTDILNTTLNRVPEFSELALQYGPYFFAVFLVLIAVGLLCLNKSRSMVLLFSVPGILFMVVATYLYSVRANPIHAYTMQIDGLTKSDTLGMPDTPMRIYQHNIVRDFGRNTFKVGLIAVSPFKLEGELSFNVYITREKKVERPDGTEGISEQIYIVSLPFRGAPHSSYSIMGIDDEEEGFMGYEVTENQIIGFNESKFIESFFISTANAQQQQVPWVVSSRQEQNIKDKTEIIYYKSLVDKDKVSSVLSSAGLDYGITNSKNNKPVNAVWIGKDIPSETVKLIGELLFENDIKLRYFGYFKNQNAKINIVQIGYSSKNKNNDVISTEKFEEFLESFEKRESEDYNLKNQQKEIGTLIQQRVYQQQQQQQQQW